MRQQGRVKWFNDTKGYGFIGSDGNSEKDLFVHYSSIRGEGHRSLKQGALVEFDVVESGKGQQASDVVVVDASNAEPV